MKLLRFTASWCGPCKALAANLEKSNNTFPIEVVDIDVYPDVAKQYGVRGVPTLIKLDGEKEIGRLVGSKPVDDINNWLVKE